MLSWQKDSSFPRQTQLQASCLPQPSKGTSALLEDHKVALSSWVDSELRQKELEGRNRSSESLVFTGAEVGAGTAEPTLAVQHGPAGTLLLRLAGAHAEESSFKDRWAAGERLISPSLTSRRHPDTLEHVRKLNSRSSLPPLDAPEQGACGKMGGTFTFDPAAQGNLKTKTAGSIYRTKSNGSSKGHSKGGKAGKFIEPFVQRLEALSERCTLKDEEEVEVPGSSQEAEAEDGLKRTFTQTPSGGLSEALRNAGTEQKEPPQRNVLQRLSERHEEMSKECQQIDALSFEASKRRQRLDMLRPRMEVLLKHMDSPSGKSNGTFKKLAEPKWNPLTTFQHDCGQSTISSSLLPHMPESETDNDQFSSSPLRPQGINQFQDPRRNPHVARFTNMYWNNTPLATVDAIGSLNRTPGVGLHATDSSQVVKSQSISTRLIADPTRGRKLFTGGQDEVMRKASQDPAESELGPSTYGDGWTKAAALVFPRAPSGVTYNRLSHAIR